MAAFTLLVDLPGVLGMAGDIPASRQALDELDAARHHGFVYLEPELLLTRAWVAAAEGSVSEAVTFARQAAELAASHPQPAVEVLALHTAVCFGDRTVADRLAVLATQVDGPRATVRVLPRPPPPARTGWRRPAKAPEPQRWPR
jgi:hypothetical protein